MTTIRLDEIRSLTDFQRNSRVHIKRLRRTGRPAVLTISGEAALVVQDVRSFQRLLDRALETEHRAKLRRSIAQYRAGRYRDMDEAIADLESNTRRRKGTKVKPPPP